MRSSSTELPKVRLVFHDRRLDMPSHDVSATDEDGVARDSTCAIDTRDRRRDTWIELCRVEGPRFRVREGAKEDVEPAPVNMAGPAVITG